VNPIRSEDRYMDGPVLRLEMSVESVKTKPVQLRKEEDP